MDDSKIFMFPDGGTKQTSDINSLLPLLMMNGGGMTALTAGLHIVVFDKQNNKLQLIV